MCTTQEKIADAERVMQRVCNKEAVSLDELHQVMPPITSELKRNPSIKLRAVALSLLLCAEIIRERDK